MAGEVVLRGDSEPKRPKLTAEDGPLTWYGITFSSQEAKDKALAELQAGLDRVTEAEQAAWRDARTTIIGSGALAQSRIEAHSESDERHLEGEQ